VALVHKIYIPTFRRVDFQITFASLPDKYKEKAILVVQEQEQHLHKLDVEYLIVDNGIGIAKTRKKIIDHAGKSRFCIYDDDIKFYRRNIKYLMKENWLDSDMKGVKRPMTEDDFDEMFNIFNSWMDNENIIQIGHRSAFLPPSWRFYTDFTDVYSGYMINGAEVSKFVDEIDWTFVEVGEDSMMSLEFLLRGYKIRRSELFCIQPKWWQEGGCSDFRDAKFHNKEHKKLMDKYPEWVYFKQEIERPNIGIIKDYRYRWKEAYRSYYTTKIRECDSLIETLPYFEHIE
jgi:hypothetical protein